MLLWTEWQSTLEIWTMAVRSRYKFNESSDDEISMEEVKSAIKRLKKHKAPGMDGLDSLVYDISQSH